jgi:DNA repair exonuclease SbcCD nuclease subunit
LRKATTPKGFNELTEATGQDKGDVTVWYMTDLHLWHRNLGSRAGSYASDILNKVREVMREATTSSADAVILGGDVFDKPNPDVAVVNAFLSSLLRYLHAGGQVLTALGEHDLYGRAPESYIRGPLGTMGMLGSMSGQVVVMCNDQDPSSVFRAQVPTQSGPINIGSVPPPEGEVDIAILHKQISDLSDVELILLHHTVSEVDLPYKYAPINDLPVIEGQVALCGHMHHPIGDTKTKYGGRVVGPGSMARTSRSDSHVPAAVKLSRSEGAWDAKIVKVPASPHEMVFGKSAAKDEFVEAVGEVKEDVLIRAGRVAGGMVGSLLSGIDRLREAVAEESTKVQQVTEDCYEEAQRGGDE